MQQLVAGILFGIDTRFLPDKLSQEIVPDVHHRTFYKRFLDFCCFKTHHLPRPAYRRIIHLVRDGRDVMASYYAMNRNMGKDVSLEEMIIEGKGISPCKWHHHTEQWIENPHEADILRVRYEDLQEDILPQLEAICDFIGLERDEALLKQVAEGCSFQQMQSKEERYGWHNKAWPSGKKFVRKGKVGSFEEEIPSALIAAFEQEAQELMQRLGYSLTTECSERQ